MKQGSNMKLSMEARKKTLTKVQGWSVNSSRYSVYSGIGEVPGTGLVPNYYPSDRSVRQECRMHVFESKHD